MSHTGPSDLEGKLLRLIDNTEGSEVTIAKKDLQEVIRDLSRNREISNRRHDELMRLGQIPTIGT
jgi:hypothetical protein